MTFPMSYLSFVMIIYIATIHLINSLHLSPTFPVITHLTLAALALLSASVSQAEYLLYLYNHSLLSF